PIAGVPGASARLIASNAERLSSMLDDASGGDSTGSIAGGGAPIEDSVTPPTLKSSRSSRSSSADGGGASPQVETGATAGMGGGSSRGTGLTGRGETSCPPSPP